MLSSIIKEYNEIEYFEFYHINEYSADECQTVYWNTEEDKFDNEYLSIRQTIDEKKSDFIHEKIVYIPDIAIKRL